MPNTAVNQTDKRQVEFLRGCLVGSYKVGKSWLAATGIDPILFLDIDQRAASVAGKPGVYTWTPTNPPGLAMQPTVYNDTLNMVATLEKTRLLGEIHPDFAKDARAGENVRTLVLDSMQSMSREILAYSLYVNPSIRREIKIAGQSLFFPGGFDAWNADIYAVDQLISRLVAIPGIDFFAIFHEEDENGKINTYPGRHRHVTRYFNEVWRLVRKTNVPETQFEPDYAFTACTTLTGVPSRVVGANIKELISKYGKRG